MPGSAIRVGDMLQVFDTLKAALAVKGDSDVGVLLKRFVVLDRELREHDDTVLLCMFDDDFSLTFEDYIDSLVARVPMEKRSHAIYSQTLSRHDTSAPLLNNLKLVRMILDDLEIRLDQLESDINVKHTRLQQQAITLASNTFYLHGVQSSEFHSDFVRLFHYETKQLHWKLWKSQRGTLSKYVKSIKIAPFLDDEDRLHLCIASLKSFRDFALASLLNTGILGLHEREPAIHFAPFTNLFAYCNTAMNKIRRGFFKNLSEVLAHSFEDELKQVFQRVIRTEYYDAFATQIADLVVSEFWPILNRELPVSSQKLVCPIAGGDARLEFVHSLVTGFTGVQSLSHLLNVILEARQCLVRGRLNVSTDELISNIEETLKEQLSREEPTTSPKKTRFSLRSLLYRAPKHNKDRGTEAEHQSITMLELFLKLQLIAYMIPSHQLNHSDEGKAFWDVAVAVLSIKQLL